MMASYSFKRSKMQYLIDASVYVFRAHYSIPEDMMDGDGNPINAFYGFSRFVGDFIERINPKHIAILFDESLESSFRNEIYPEYKANRDPAPPELKKQFVHCKNFVDLLGITNWSHPRYEADDLIGTLARIGREQGRASTIISRDKDLAQLIQKGDIFWDYTGKGKIGYEEIPDFFGVKPEQIADFLALAGDSVDNIPGVPGIGKKTAAALLEHFGNLKNIYLNIDNLSDVNVRGSKTIKSKLNEHSEKLEVSRKLTAIYCDIETENIDSELNLKAVDLEGVTKLFDSLQIGTALRKQAERISEKRKLP